MKCDSTDHHGFHAITSYDLIGDEDIKIKFQRDLRKMNEVYYICLFLFRLHSDLQKNTNEHQNFHNVANDIVFKLRTKNESHFPRYQVTDEHERYKLPRMIKNVVTKRQNFYQKKRKLRCGTDKSRWKEKQLMLQ